jgi:hypothetical protein
MAIIGGIPHFQTYPYWNLCENTSVECQGDILGLWKARMFFLRRCVEGVVWGKKRGSGVKKKPAAIEKLKLGTWDAQTTWKILEDLILKGLMCSSLQKPGCKPQPEQFEIGYRTMLSYENIEAAHAGRTFTGRPTVA